ncbi:contractile injection system tape measure protein [Marinigracilibium pacificum]|uniref:Uncharacterized protein n=1 Tax=Marinigracilibium pacificum TaxID=2729599 RepID=A0A848J1T5_9BACT|nr:contractile injection system tape measure protein [Marinigracilibium pacificum]NMM49671.1 hypothetical protein [Marinigracilibium pacificum]
MTQSNHIIHRQVIDLKVSDKEEGLRWQKEFSSYYKDTVLPAFEKACDELCAENELIRINKIEIDIDKITSSSLRRGVTQGLVKKFKEEILKVASESLTLVNKTSSSNHQTFPEGVSSISRSSTSLYDTIIYFLEFGVLPWWSSTLDFDVSKGIEQLYRELHDQSLSRFTKRLNSLLVNKQSHRRIVDVCPTTLLIQIFDPNNEYDLQGLIKDFQKLDDRINLKREFFNGVINNCVIRSSNSSVLIDIEGVVISVIKKLGYTFSEVHKFQNMLVEKTGANSSLVKVFNEFIDDNVRVSNKIAINQLVGRNSGVKISEEYEGNYLSIKFNLQEDESIELANAGSVLLWTYLPMFFSELKLMKKGEFNDRSSQERAVQLLHFLVNGEIEAEEHQWVIFKLLCGLNPSEFVSTEFEPTEEESIECNNLLQSVIRNWPVLKNTSPSGLQKSFLRRPGLLKKDVNGWMVHIERIAIDILLDRLNWPISVIRLPWNENVIHVKW